MHGECVALSPCMVWQGSLRHSGSLPRSNQICFMELLPASQQEAPPVPDQLCDQALPAPHSSVQAKKVSAGGSEASW